tara:strand:- start:184 stop:342 length:159 start_codon:yes stop_codon:yes gene_type:complete
MSRETTRKAARRIIHIADIIQNEQTLLSQKKHELESIKALAEMIIRENTTKI